MKTVAITGSNGFVGQSLTKKLEENGYKVIGIPRKYLSNPKEMLEIVEKSDGLINLAGANIISRWTKSYKKLLYNSRIDTTKALIHAIEKAKNRPKFLISTSAVGIYKNDKAYDEYSKELSDDFLGKLAFDWESEALKAKEFGIRTAIFRFGIILGHGGALEKMLPPFKLGLGGTIGDGKQAFSFIHIEDLLDAYLHVMQDESLEGVFNLSAPKPTTNRGLTKTLGKYLHRPTVLPVPQFALQLLFSEGAQVLTDGQSAVPKRLLESGFNFKYPDIETSIKDLV